MLGMTGFNPKIFDNEGFFGTTPLKNPRALVNNLLCPALHFKS